MPKWAQELTINTAIHLGCELPDIRWRHGSGFYSSGTCYTDHIVITAGKNRRDCKLVLLHEIAHFVNPHEHHSPKFWDTAFTLYKWAGLPLRVCVGRERGYRKEAANAYKRIKAKC